MGVKWLEYRCSSVMDGEVAGTIGPRGIELAATEGRRDLKQRGISLDRLFHSPLLETAATALAYISGQQPGLFIYMPVAEEMGTDELFAEMSTEAFRQAVKGGLSYFEALIDVHGAPRAKVWAGRAAEGVCKMFDRMNKDEIAVAFGDPLIIQLAIWRFLGFELPESFGELCDLEGVVFIQAEDKTISVGEKISVEPLE